MLLSILLCILCAPQSPAPAPATPTPAQMSPEFSKSALRALLAIGDESDVVIKRYISDANVEAQSKAETDTVRDLNMVALVVALNKQRVLTQISKLRYLNGSSGLDERVQKDSEIQAWLKQNSDCTSDETAMLRSRVYSPLPASCN